MKLNIKGLVFVGFAAAVFAGAANADSTVTSKTYVDNKIAQSIVSTDTAKAPSGAAVHTALAAKEDSSNKVEAVTDANKSSTDNYPSNAALVGYVASQINTAGGNYQTASATGQEQYVANGNGGWVALTKDSTPTQDSTNPITSGAVYAHTSNGDIHVTSTDKTNWNGKVDGVATGTSGVGTINVTDGGETTQVTVYGLGSAAGADVAADGVADGETGLVNGDEVYEYVAGQISNYGTNHVINDGQLSIQVGSNTAQTFTANDADNVTVTLGAAAGSGLAASIANNETGLVTGDQVYDYVANPANVFPSNPTGENASCSADNPCALVWTGSGSPTWERIAQQ